MKKLFLIGIGLVMLSLCAEGQTRPDSVTASLISDCCYEFTLKNRNSSQSPIDEFEIAVQTAGVDIIPTPGPLAPANWSVTTTKRDTVRFAADPRTIGIRAGMNLSGFRMCFANTVTSFRILWRTYNNGKLVSQGNLTLQCAVNCDQVKAQSLGGCCYNWLVSNNNSKHQPITDFHLQVITAGVSFSSVTPPSGWNASTPTPSSVNFVAPPPGIGISPGKELKDFLTCFTAPSSGTTSMRVIWTTTYNGQNICVDTVTLRCVIPDAGCDSVGIKLNDNCCYEFTVANRNTQKTPIGDFHVKILTAGVSIAGAPESPAGWTFTTGTNEVTWLASSPIASGDQLGGFKLCFAFAGGIAIPFEIEWRTTDGKRQTICSDTAGLQCSVQSVCDSLLFEVAPGANCCFNVTLKNRHTPFGPLNDLHIKIASSGASFVPGTVNGPWAVASANSTEIAFSSAASALASGNDLPGFTFCLSTATGVVELSWETTLNGMSVCFGREIVQCDPTQERCDSVRAIGGDDCCYDFVLHNLHTPAGLITDFHVEVLTPGATIRPTPASPAGWVLSDLSSTTAKYKHATGAGLISGGIVGGFKPCFDNIPSSGVIEILWCTTYNDNVICCERMFLQCAPSETRCDSVEALKRSDCCYDFKVKNRHLPAGLVTDFHLKVLTSGVTISGTPAGPAGWVMTNTAISVDFREPTGNGIPHMGDKSGFVVCFDNVPASGVVELLWCTTMADQNICCDTIRIECAPTQLDCDEVTPILIDDKTCCWDFRVNNRHQPPSALNDFHLRVITPGVVITSVNKPLGWTVANNAASAVYSTSTNPLASGSILTGFVACFNPAQINNQPFQVVWETTLDQRVICVDTVTLLCALNEVEKLDGSIPMEFQLHQNYPNPFNPVTTISFDVPVASDVELTVFDAAGRTYITLVRERIEAGRWQTTFDASSLPSGAYQYRLRALGASVDASIVRSMMLLK